LGGTKTGPVKQRQPKNAALFLNEESLSTKSEQPSATDLVEALDVTMRERGELEQQLRELDADLAARSDEVDSLREKIDAAEVALVQSTLHTVEAEQRLPLAKLLERSVCPACGTHQAHLQRIAREHAESGQCLLCGAEEHAVDWATLAELQSQLSEKLRAQRAVDDRRRTLKGRLQSIHLDEERLSLRIAAQVPATVLASPVLGPEVARERRGPADVKQRLVAAQREEARLLTLVQTQQRRLSRAYEGFRQGVTDRLELLREMYIRYATAFLGHECTLAEVPSDDRLFSLNQFVPRFNGVVRHQPESCSEAQQFFLDIALRMAFISLGSRLAGAPGAFLCETPENALDMSYVDNVAKMFTDFADEKHSIVLTANIQENGLYQRFLTGSKAAQAQRVLNLLEYGQLSDVQKRALKALRKHSPSGGKRER
jgi:predicted RNA-binding Zn-ribbon protein involved in translation (DUF1610 family)